jgi:O-antigen/teichoic acid export membrane protein
MSTPTSPQPADRSTRLVAAVRSNILTFPAIGLLGFAASIAVAHALSPSLFALYAAALAIRGTLQFLADLGTGQASSRIFAELDQRGARRSAWRLYGQLAAARSVFILGLALFLTLASGLAAALFDLNADEHYYLAFIAVVGAAEVTAGLGHYLLIGTLDQPRLNRVMIAQAVIQPVLVLAAVAADLGLQGILAALVAGSVLKAVALNVLAVRRISRFDEREGTIANVGRTYSRVAVSSILGKLAAWLNSRQILTIVALSTTTRADVAMFALAYDFATQVLTYSASPVNGVVLPAMSAATDERRRADLFEMTTRGLALLLLPIGAILAAVSTTLIPAVFGSTYDDAVPFALVFVPGIAVELTLTAAATGLMLASNDLLRAYSWIKATTALLAGFYILALHIDLLVVAATMMTIRVGSSLALHIAVRRRRHFGLDVHWLARAVVSASAAAAASAGVLHATSSTWLQLILGVSVGALVYALLVRVLGVVTAADVAIASRLHPVAARVVGTLVKRPAC